MTVTHNKNLTHFLAFLQQMNETKLHGIFDDLCKTSSSDE